MPKDPTPPGFGISSSSEASSESSASLSRSLRSARFSAPPHLPSCCHSFVALQDLALDNFVLKHGPHLSHVDLYFYYAPQFAPNDLKYRIGEEQRTDS